MKKKFLEINLPKIIGIYTLGFFSAIFLPKKQFLDIMNYQHEKINSNLKVIEKDTYYKII
jgi:hypothetical protein